MQEGPLRPYCGDSMDKYAQSIRYPPFELEHMNPRNIPISKASIDNFDIIAGVPVGGLILATALGLEKGQSTIYVRKNQYHYKFE